MTDPEPRPLAPTPAAWSPRSWLQKSMAQAVSYEHPEDLERVEAELGRLPPLVTSFEIERLKQDLAEAQLGRRFLMQGGDCAETFDDCQPEVIINRLKVLLQMSVVLIQAAKKPVVRVGRFAGQYAKPRSSSVEVRDGVELPSYFGDLVNQPDFDPASRRADPERLLRAYWHSALTLNHVRSLASGGFADLHHPEYWDLSFFDSGDLPPELQASYRETTRQVSEALRFMEALGDASLSDMTRVDFYTSHEGLSLPYEAAQTRRVQQHPGYYDLTTHMPWIGERTRALDGAHVEFFRGIDNPVGVKLGPTASGEDAVRLLDVLNPRQVPGKIVLITRMGATKVSESLPPLVKAVKASGHPVLWVSDPMHGNTVSAPSGRKTRSFDAILQEVERTFDVHEELDTIPGGIHLELTGEDVTECTGSGVSEADLERNYVSRCDPRLNYRQSLEMAFRVGSRMGRSAAT